MGFGIRAFFRVLSRLIGVEGLDRLEGVQGFRVFSLGLRKHWISCHFRYGSGI